MSSQPTMQATWHDTVLAQSNQYLVIEGNYYFPPESVNKEYLKKSKQHSTCPWKGKASYYTIALEGEVNENAAWYYPEPKEEAKKQAGDFSNYVAFWNGVEVRQKKA